MSPARRRVLWGGAVATIGVGLTGVGEFLLHYAPQGWGEARQFTFLEPVSASRLAWGHFLAMLAAPSYFLGYWHVAQGLRPASAAWRQIFFGASLYFSSSPQPG